MKIYSVRTHNNDSLIYYGFTKQPLHKRLNDYKSRFKRHLKNCDNFLVVFEIFNCENVYIRLEEELETDNKDIVRSVLNRFISENDCLNRKAITKLSENVVNQLSKSNHKKSNQFENNDLISIKPTTQPLLLTYNDEQKNTETERIEKERLETERIEKERLETERLEKVRLETERIEKERLETERLEKERLETERLENERKKAERQKKEKQKDAEIKREQQEQQLDAVNQHLENHRKSLEEQKLKQDQEKMTNDLARQEQFTQCIKDDKLWLQKWCKTKTLRLDEKYNLQKKTRNQKTLKLFKI